MGTKHKILAISGSLRTGSWNTALLKELKRLTPDKMEIYLAKPINRLPHFNPDLDSETPLPEVKAWREELKSADGIFIASPEYAFSIPGVLKNALDWVVGSGEFVHKPVVLINASPGYGGARNVQAALTALLKVMSANVLENVSVSVASVKKKFDQNQNLIDEETIRFLQNACSTLTRTIAESQDIKD
ncbi:MAG: NAD(P)H-dependent oxidoreductase [Leptospira sp.]|nr:NAD(P)H-dependent oxidoreductase [Leptospira sp.]